MAVTVLIFVTDHMVTAGVYDQLLPVPTAYTFCCQQVPRMAVALGLRQLGEATHTFIPEGSRP